MPLAEQLVRQRYVRSGPRVLGTAPIKYPAPTTDRDRTISRRSEPSSRAALIGEQPNPWDLVQPLDPTDDVQFYIDYTDFRNSRGGKCIAHASRIPEGVIECTVTPEVFDCVEERRQ